MARSLPCVFFLIFLTWTVTAAPQLPRLSLLEAGVHGDPGDTALSIGWHGRWHGSISRVLCPWGEVTASASEDSLFELSGQLVVARGAYPLVLGASIAADSIALLSSLHLGPVRLDAARTWSRIAGRGTTPSAVRGAVVRLTAQPFLTMLLGAEDRNGHVDGLAGIELHRDLSGLSLVVARSGWRVEWSTVIR